MIKKKILTTEIKAYKKDKVISTILQSYLQEMIEVDVSKYGNDLPREDTIQDLWVFVIKILPKINCKKNAFAYLHTALRHEIGHIRIQSNRHNHLYIEEIGIEQ